MILKLITHFFKIEKNLVGAAILFSLLYGFIYSFFWIDPLPLKGFALLTWINILFALFLIAPNIYTTDFNDGFLDLIFSQKLSILKLFYTKIIFILLGYFVPILLTSFLNGFFFNQDFETIIQIMLGPLILSPAIILLIHTGSLFTLNSNSSGFLIPILMIPFFIPLLIFGISISIKFHEKDQSLALLLGGLGIDIVYCIFGLIFSKLLMEEHFR